MVRRVREMLRFHAEGAVRPVHGSGTPLQPFRKVASQIDLQGGHIRIQPHRSAADRVLCRGGTGADIARKRVGVVDAAGRPQCRRGKKVSDGSWLVQVERRTGDGKEPAARDAVRAPGK